jgi:hypothetical protein
MAVRGSNDPIKIRCSRGTQLFQLYAHKHYCRHNQPFALTPRILQDVNSRRAIMKLNIMNASA